MFEIIYLVNIIEVDINKFYLYKVLMIKSIHLVDSY